MYSHVFIRKNISLISLQLLYKASYFISELFKSHKSQIKSKSRLFFFLKYTGGQKRTTFYALSRAIETLAL
ncbi:hypothetical protein BpHYR1_034152 [Brachionus plicatilis]|uniref:Uncharacterized protein n=1 Tax=Brachionus plicatilis TaxID=10195 RepID=A0A3M7S6Y8_BRAPC|nr:hypothetical protein BpHYR1_034152 [Brachionus plicatilis]